MNVGFTGTKAGMTGNQAVGVGKLLLSCFEFRSDEFHFGVCVGADEQAAEIASWIHFTIVGHPASDVPWRFAGRMPREATSKTVLDMKPALERNHDIVDATRVLIAAPREMNEVLRSGTWATIRYARKQNKPVWTVWPNGLVTKDREVV